MTWRAFDSAVNSLTQSDQNLIASATAESNALTLGTAANWMDVTEWRLATTGLGRAPNSPLIYRAVKEFDLEIACDATETLTSPQLFGVRQLGVTLADDTFTASGDTMTATAHAYLTGDGPVRLTNSGGALPGGLSTDTDYWVIYASANTFKLATSLANAVAGTAVTTTGAGTGTHTVVDKQSPEFPRLDDQTKRLHWFLYGDLNGASTITVGAQQAYIERIQHSPMTLYYEVVASSGTGAQTLTMRCVPVQSVEW